MPLFHNGDDLVLFVHIPKCGGTAIENSFRSAGWEWGYLNEPKKTGYDEKPCNPQHFHAELIEELIVPGDNTTDQIIVVRNPQYFVQSTSAVFQMKRIQTLQL